MRITPLGDSALVVEVGERVDELTHHRVQAAFRLLDSPPLAGVTEVVPAFTTLTLFSIEFELCEDRSGTGSAVKRRPDSSPRPIA